jgi:uncharacterized protein DUF3303
LLLRFVQRPGGAFCLRPPASVTLSPMLFMVIERVRPENVRAVGERFREGGRMMPDDVTYHASWLDMTGATCFQVMEAPCLESLQGWIRNWQDLVDFEVIPVLTSVEFWASKNKK